MTCTVGFRHSSAKRRLTGSHKYMPSFRRNKGTKTVLSTLQVIGPRSPRNKVGIWQVCLVRPCHDTLQRWRNLGSAAWRLPNFRCSGIPAEHPASVTPGNPTETHWPCTRKKTLSSCVTGPTPRLGWVVFANQRPRMSVKTWQGCAAIPAIPNQATLDTTILKIP